MNVLEKLQRWYQDQCDGEWEHSFGITIDTLDNPGWSVTIDLEDTEFSDTPFNEISNLDPKVDWIRCWKEEAKFNGVGGPQQLEEILSVFLKWTESEGGAV